jgi:hypothetical protein
LEEVCTVAGDEQLPALSVFLRNDFAQQPRLRRMKKCFGLVEQ